MTVWTYLLVLLAGALLCNSVPHLANGLSGRAFPTPFAKPPGRGPSPPAVNALWGSANLLVGVFLLSPRAILLTSWPGFGAFAVGFVGMAVPLARHFGKVRGS